MRGQGRAGVGQLLPPGSSSRVQSPESEPGRLHLCPWSIPASCILLPGSPQPLRWVEMEGNEKRQGPPDVQGERGGGKSLYNPRMGFPTASGMCQGILSWLQGDAIAGVGGG